jgi:Ni/Co efflux regulator RcnB
MIARLIICFIFLGFLSNPLSAQEDGGPPKKEQSLKSKRKQRKEDKKRWKEDRRKKRAEEKNVKAYHKRIQTKEVRKRMKRNKKVAQRNHDHQREPFFQRVFKKKGKRKSVKQPQEKVKNG